MISEDCGNDAENTALITEINYILTHSHRTQLFYILIIWEVVCHAYHIVSLLVKKYYDEITEFRSCHRKYLLLFK